VIKNIIFDFDDTLADCGIFYREQQNKFAAYQASRTGLPVELISKLRESIDVHFTQTPDGFNRVRFPRSFASTSMTIDVMLGNKVDEVAAYQSFELGDEVFNAMYPLCPGIPEMLDSFRDAGHQLFLLTKGDFEVQTRKIVLNGLDRWFQKDRMYIVPQKTPQSLQRVLDDHGLNTTDTIVVGDSLRDDIANAHAVGCESVWVSGRHNAAWAYENTQVEVIYSTENAADLGNLLDPKTGNFTIAVSSR
jgi:putative hydrolase of the HAD superfamily